MDQPLWGRRPPRPDADVVGRWAAEPATPGELTWLRVHLRDALLAGARPAGADDGDIERLLLAFEELASNGLRHGGAPVRVSVATTGSGWLLDVSDAAADRPPAPAVGRDAADGGLGLYLVAGLCAQHGWAVEGGRKHVWARIDFAVAPPGPASVPCPRDDRRA